MQVKIKLGDDWWMLPCPQEFTEKELELFHDVPYVAALQPGEMVKFFDMRPKKKVKVIISTIGSMHYQGFIPYLKDGIITFKKPTNQLSLDKS